MNRRNLFRNIVRKATQSAPSSAFIRGGLDPYAGPWNSQQASHLLRRTMFGPTLEQIETSTLMGLEGTLETLMDPNKIPKKGPVNHGKIEVNGVVKDINDPNVKVGEQWVKRSNGKWIMGSLPSNEALVFEILTYRDASVKVWKTEFIMKEGISIYEKMGLFWNNHFGVTSENGLVEFLLNITLLENALGNFRELVKKITIDPGMMLFLNGNTNTKQAPNENFARELLELFTIGKGDLAGPGDYTNFTEEDIKEASKLLTGWAINGPKLYGPSGFVELSSDNLSLFLLNRHDTNNKAFSSRFGNKVITSNGANEYKDLINMIFEQDECARFICRKLYRWFVYYKISDEIEVDIIEPLAELLIMNDYEIKPVIETLLSSEHFFDIMNEGPMIKNPIDFITTLTKPFNFLKYEPTDLYEKAKFYAQIYNLGTLFQMTYFNPPTVAGWKAYYQEPLYYRTWINSTTLNYKMQISRSLSLTLENQGPGLDILKAAQQIEGARDPNILIAKLSELLHPQELSEDQLKSLKSTLLPGLPDFEWTVEYGGYLSDPSNDNLRFAIEVKLRQLLKEMIVMPEFYLS